MVSTKQPQAPLSMPSMSLLLGVVWTATVPVWRSEAFALLPPASRASIQHHKTTTSTTFTSRLFLAAGSSSGSFNTTMDAHYHTTYASEADSGVVIDRDAFFPFLEFDESLEVVPTQQPQPSQQNSIQTARLLLLGAAALYGTNFACVKMLGGSLLPVASSSVLRFGLASLVTLPWLLPANNHSNNDDKVGAIMAGLEVGVWNSIGYMSQAIGLETTLASKSAFLCSLAVLVVPLLDFVFKGKTVKSHECVGVVLALVGVAGLELGGGGDSSTAMALDLSADGISLLQPFFFGLGFWKMEQAMHQYPNQATRSTAAQLLAVFCGSVLYANSVGDLSAIWETSWYDSPWMWAGLLWTGVITTALTVFMETVALQTLSASETTLIFSTEPLWGSLAAVLLLHETLGLNFLVGGSLVLSGCLLGNLGWDALVPSKETVP